MTTYRNQMFQLTRPAGGEPSTALKRCGVETVSTHSPRGGRTAIPTKIIKTQPRFNSLAPRGANLGSALNLAGEATFQLTRPAGGEP